MIKLIEALGRLVVRLYINKAKHHDRTAKADAKVAEKLAAGAQRALEASKENTAEAAKFAAKAQKLKEFF